MARVSAAKMAAAMVAFGALKLTNALNDDVASDSKVAKDVIAAIARFRARDWGELSDDDKAENDVCIENISDPDFDGCILAKYNTKDGPIYISGYIYDGKLNNLLAMYCEEY